jgi:hypothetical protein
MKMETKNSCPGTARQRGENGHHNFEESEVLEFDTLWYN